MCTLCQARDPRIEHHDMHGAENFSDGDLSVAAAKPVYTYDQIAEYLTQGFWSDFGSVASHFDVQSGGTITYNLDGLTALGAATALKALDAWTAVTGLQFQEVAKSSAQMVFDDTNAGAYAFSSIAGGHIIKSHINVHESWSNYGDYYYQTYMHEIGHALGLGHTGDYNGSADYALDAGYANDSWQTSVMSYFSQSENTWTNASQMYLATLQLGDIAAIHRLYGTPANVETGDTVYGDGETTGGRFGMNLAGNFAVAIVDSGGTDLINLGSRSHNQHLSLVAETYSNINGRIGNFSIGRDTVIENVITGSGNDHIIGNDADNRIESGAGNDTILAGAGNDTLIGGAGADILTGGTGADRFVYRALADAGDTITDFSLGEGDQIDVTGLLSAIGYGGADPVADGVFTLLGASGGSWLMVHDNGSSVHLAFLAGIAQSANLSAILGIAQPAPEPQPGSQSGGVDTVHVIGSDFRDTWTEEISIITDSDGGIDTLDLSAIQSSVYVSLVSGVKGWVDGQALFIAEGTEIENLILGDGGDRAFGNEAANTMFGHGGNDRIHGGGGDDIIDGGDGHDTIYGDDGNDTITGGSGNDRLHGGAGDDVIDGGDGRDKLYGGDGNDTLNGGADNDQIYSGSGNNVIDGGAGHDSIFAENGDDVIWGRDGNDRIRATGGNNWIDAGEGDNRVDTGAGDDVILAGAGKDRINAGFGNDTIDAGDGDNIVTASGGDNQIIAGAGNDWITTGSGNDVIHAGGGANRISAGAGKNIVTALDGDDIITTGNGIDIIDAGDGNNQVSSGNGADIVRTGSGADRIETGMGNDVVFSGGGDDWIRAGSGADFVDAGDGDDKVYGEAGNDTIHGGAGNDRLYGGDGDDLIFGGTGDDIIRGDDGHDTLHGGDGDDDMRGGAGNDTLHGDDGADILRGEAGDDVLLGGAGTDWLFGGTGNDILDGGAGVDILDGGEGADVFVFSSLDGLGDTIRDFDLAEGDLLDIGGILDALGTSLSGALSSGALALRPTGLSSWLSLDDDEGSTLDIAFLHGIGSGSTLDESWFHIA